MVRRTAAAAALMLVVLAACGKGEDRPGTSSASASGTTDATTSTAFTPADATTRVDVSAHEFMFDGIPATVAGPNVLFTVKNTGKDEHELEIVAPDGEPAGEVHVGPGATKTLAVKLRPGRYTAQCLLKEGKRTHAELGMKTAFTVT
jgi:uncharacterized cupredoxin-like copper-binding protein